VGEPRVRALLDTTYSIGGLALTWEADWQASQEIFDSRVLIDDPDQRSESLLETGDFWQHDFTLRYEVNDHMRLRAGVINAFDNEPSAAAELAPVASPSAAGNVDQFDVFGRRFFVGLNYRF
jgi:outer membrane receptor protein involved in Fe transport